MRDFTRCRRASKPASSASSASSCQGHSDQPRLCHHSLQPPKDKQHKQRSFVCSSTRLPISRARIPFELARDRSGMLWRHSNSADFLRMAPLNIDRSRVRLKGQQTRYSYLHSCCADSGSEWWMYDQYSQMKDLPQRQLFDFSSSSVKCRFGNNSWRTPQIWLYIPGVIPMSAA